MSLQKIVTENGRAWALWQISETEAAFAKMLDGAEAMPTGLTHPTKRLEWLAGRVLLKAVFAHLNVPYTGITKNEHGKPSAIGNTFHVSLSHSFPFVAALVDENGPAGIDLEQPKTKLFRVAHRIFHPDELRDAGNDLIKHCVYWCAKEALVKIHGKKDLIFASNLYVFPFSLAGTGDIHGRIIAGGTETIIPLHYQIFPGFVLVFNRPVTI